MRNGFAIIMSISILFVLILSGCTTENHRVLITVSNNMDISQNIKVDIDGEKRFTATLDPAEGVEKEFELSKGDHTFELYKQINGTYQLYKTETMYIEADSSLFFELE